MAPETTEQPTKKAKQPKRRTTDHLIDVERWLDRHYIQGLEYDRRIYDMEGYSDSSGR